ncbi:MAG TPA: MlaD family protein, partial [Verrucomicrobiota bacterium]|nr:MlaD family protein [Verrucomicrobiota bacterium]
MPSARKVGVFVAVTLAIIGGMVLNFSKGRGLFTPSYTIRIVSDGVGGLKVGGPVTLSGVPVGNVSSIDLTPDQRAVEITARILKKYRIHGDARFDIQQSGFLGDEFVAIVPQENSKPMLTDGAVVNSAPPFNLQEAAKSATALLAKLDVAVDRINGAVARVDKKLLGDDTITNLVATAANLRQASAEAVDTLGDVRRLVTNNSPAVAAVLSNLTTLSFKLTTVATNVDDFLAEQRPAVSEVLSNAGAATADLKTILADVRAGRGVVGSLVSDEVMRAQVGGVVTNFGIVS